MRSSATGRALELPAVHFRCGHSVNAAELGEDDTCPLCTGRHRTLAQIGASMRPSPALEERLIAEREASEDPAAGVTLDELNTACRGRSWRRRGELRPCAERGWCVVDVSVRCGHVACRRQ